MKEPSSYAACGAAIGFAGIVFDFPMAIWAGIVVAGLGFIIKETSEESCLISRLFLKKQMTDRSLLF